MAFTIASVLIRFVAGKLSDNYGRVIVLKAALLLLTFSLILVGAANSTLSLLVASVVYGIATGILSPANNAWTIDLSLPEHRGKAVATMYIALEAGIGLGAFFAGTTFQDRIETIPAILYASSGLAFTAFLYLMMRKD